MDIEKTGGRDYVSDLHGLDGEGVGLEELHGVESVLDQEDTLVVNEDQERLDSLGV